MRRTHFKPFFALLLTLVLAFSCFSASAADDKATAGLVRGKVTDDNSNMMVASILIEDETGATRRAFTNAMGAYSLALEPGDYTLTFMKGNEFSTATKTVSVERLKTYYLPDVRLTALFDSYALGWIAGDTHQHTYYSDGINAVDESMVGNAAAGLYFGFLTDHNTSRGVPEWTGALRMNVRSDAVGQPRYFMGFDGVEVTTEFGHYNSLGSGLTLDIYDTKLTEAERSSKEKLDYARGKIMYIADSIRRIGGVAQMNHPYSTTTMGMANWIDASDLEVFDQFDTMEIWNGYFLPCDGTFDTQNAMNQNSSSTRLWYALLNQMKQGHAFHAAVGGTDNHDIFAPVTAKANAAVAQVPTTLEEAYDTWCAIAKYNGMPTTYIHADGGAMTLEHVQQAVREGHSFVTSGPIVIASIEDKTYGDTITLQSQAALTLDTNIWNRDGLRQIRVVKNGDIVKTIDLAEGEVTYTAPITLEGEWEKMDWVLLEVLGPFGQYAITNPILIDCP